MKDWSKNPLIVIIGLLGSMIAIITFATGVENIPQLFAVGEPSPEAESQDLSVLPRITATALLTPDPLYLTPQTGPPAALTSTTTDSSITQDTPFSTTPVPTLPPTTIANAQSPQPRTTVPTATQPAMIQTQIPEVSASVRMAADWLISNHQNNDGGYSSFSPGANKNPSDVSGTLDAILALTAAGYSVDV